MKRTALLRKTPLQRGGRIKAKSPRRIQEQTPEEARYLDWLHKRPCAAKGMRYEHDWYFVNHYCHAGVYEGQEPIQASHIRNKPVALGGSGSTGTGRKDGDRTCIPLCREMHEAFDQAKGPFASMSKYERKAWHVSRNVEQLAAFYLETGIQLLEPAPGSVT